MAGDWIPIRKNLHRTREVLQIAQRTGNSPFFVAGVLLAFWAWVDDECTDGFLSGLEPDILPIAVGESADFWRAVVEAGWLVVEAGIGMRIPNHDRWISRTAKARLLDSRRKRASRAETAQVAAQRPVSNRTEAGQKPDQRRVEEKKEEKKEEKREKGRQIAPASSSRIDDPLVLIFCDQYRKAYTVDAPVEYSSTRGDFVQLATLKKTQGAELEMLWCRAVVNYLETPRSSHTIADLCVHFATFQKSSLDRYNKPVEEKHETANLRRLRESSDLLGLPSAHSSANHREGAARLLADGS